MAGATHLESTRLALDHVRRFLEIRKGELSALDTEIEREAEPQVVGLTPQTPVNRKANTMKTYLLRDPNAVEPQNPRRARPSQPPSSPAAATVRTILGRADASSPALFLGLDVHNDSSAVLLTRAVPSTCGRAEANSYQFSAQTVAHTAQLSLI